MRRFWVAAAGAGAGLALLLAGCSDPASRPARDHAAADGATAPAASEPAAERRDFAAADTREDRRERRSAERDGPDPRDAPVPQLDGRPMWTATSRYTAEENAERAFERHRADFAYRDADAYVAAAHAFIQAPPRDVLTLTRTNGDKLLYAPGDNLFAVATAEGAPRTFFKPEEGLAYWREQEEREANRNQRRADRGDREGDRG
jgi:pyocin large subunit-like protein